jgi:N-acetylmuramate 1-kinase
MTQQLQEGGFSYESYTRTALPGDASTRRYFRLTPDAGDGPAASLILMIFEGASRQADAENFVEATDLFTSLGCPLPAIVQTALPEGTLILEDLGDVTLEQVVAGDAFSYPLYEEAIRILVRIQARCGTKRRAHPAIFDRNLDAGRIGFELDFLRRHGLERERNLSAAESRSVDAAFARIIEKVGTMPRVLNHRDYHSRNIMVRGEKITLIDFQDALMASPFYDVASLLRDSYAAIPAAAARELFDGYLDAARAAQVTLPASNEKAAALFDLVAYQRNVKALGTFAFQGHVRGRRQFLDSIPNTCRHIAANPEASHPVLSPLTELIMERLGESR